MLFGNNFWEKKVNISCHKEVHVFVKYLFVVRNIHSNEALANLEKNSRTQIKVGLQNVTPAELYVNKYKCNTNVIHTSCSKEEDVLCEQSIQLIVLNQGVLKQAQHLIHKCQLFL